MAPAVNPKGPRVNNPVVSRSFLAAALLAVCSVSGAADARTPGRQSPAPSDDFIQREMGGAIASVERSLQVLVELERGDEGPRKTNALGSTVAGAAGPPRAPVPMSDLAGPDTALGQARAAERKAQGRQALGARVRLTWTGPAEGLLRDLAGRIGFEFAVRGHGSAPVVRIKRQETTVEDLLRTVAAQIEPSADIRVDTVQRRMVLDFRSADTSR